MLYDILLALFGHSGDVIEECVEKEGTFTVSNDIQLTITERDAINVILKTANLYRIVKKFCESVEQNDYLADLAMIFDIKDESSKFSESFDNKIINSGSKNLLNSHGYYLIALCNGIQYYLKGYRYVLLKMEDIMTTDDTLPISTFTVLMKDQNEILHSINRIIVNYKYASMRCDERDVFSKSRELLNILSEDHDEKLFDEIAMRLKSDVLKFLKFQLRSWICHGHLLDPYSEFVISYRDMKNIDPDSQMPLNSFQKQEQEQKQNFGSGYDDYDSSLLEYEWNYKFYIKLDKRSKFGPIDYKSCKSILFIGKVIRVLSRSSSSSRQHLISLADEYIFDVWDEISIDSDKFYLAIEKYRSYISTLFWNFVNKNFNIISQLELFKNVYLMNHDSVYDDFFEETYTIMSEKYSDRSFKIVNKKLLTLISSMKDIYSSTDGYLIGGSKTLGLNGSNDETDNGTEGFQELSLVSEDHLLKEEEEMFYIGTEYDNRTNVNGNGNKRDTDNFELIKYVNNFNINSKFIDINNVKYEGDCFHVGSDSSLWYGEPIFVMHNFNIHLIIDMNKLNLTKQFSVVLSSSYFNRFNEDAENLDIRINRESINNEDSSNNKENNNLENKENKDKQKGIDTKEYISVGFKFIYSEEDEKLKIIITVIYKNMYNNNKTFNNNKSIIIGKKEKVVKFNKNEELMLELDMSFKKNSLKINLKSFTQQIEEFITHYSMESMYTTRSNSYEDLNSKEYQDREWDSSEEEDNNNNDLNGTLFYRRSSVSSNSEIVEISKNKDRNINNNNNTNSDSSNNNDNENNDKNNNTSRLDKNKESYGYIDISVEIASLDIIEILKLISNSLYIGVINHSDLEYKESEDEVEIEKDINNNNMKDREESISILIWDYYNKLSRYDILPYYKVKQFLENNSFIDKIQKDSDLDIYNENEYINRKDKEEKEEESNMNRDSYLENEGNSINEYDEDSTDCEEEEEGTKMDTKIGDNSKIGKEKIETKENEKEEREELKMIENIGINEWIYLLLYYRFEFISFINIKSYNNIFQIIFTIKRCLFGLENRCIINQKVRTELTKNQISSKDNKDDYSNHNNVNDNSNNINTNNAENYSLLRKLYGFKHYFQTNLKMILYYFYNHVIEPEYLELKELISRCKDFQIIKKKHDEYINNILSKCISNHYVLYALFQCLDISFKFTYIFENVKDLYKLSQKEVMGLSNTLDQMKETYQEHFSTLNKNYELTIF